MAFDWTAYLEVAQALVEGRQPNDEEAILRTAIGRAYYAAFNTAIDYCLAQRRRFHGDGRDHEQVRIHLASMGLTDLADNLLRLHRWRKQVDYHSTLQYDLKMMWLGASIAANAVVTELHRRTDNEGPP